MWEAKSSFFLSSLRNDTLSFHRLTLHLCPQLIGPQFIKAIRPSLEEQWTEDLQEAWLQLFRYMSWVMKLAIEQERITSGVAAAH